jgi:aspartate kinase
MDITTLGRGGSDTTAVALAAKLKANICEIYTDVEGIYTADPRIVPNARKIPNIAYAEMLELASYGAKMHPRSIELGALYNVPILVASSFTESSGTLINWGDNVELVNRVTGIAHDRNVAKITVSGIPDTPGIAAALFEPLSEKAISVDTIVQNSGIDNIADLTFTVDRNDLSAAMSIIRPVTENMGARSCESDSTLSKVSIVGTGMQNHPGYASLMFKSLYEANVNIEMITTSEIRITCIISEYSVESAVLALHNAFHLEQVD